MPLTTTATWPDLVAGKKAKASEVEEKFDWLEGSLLPMNNGAMTSNIYDLGMSSASWRATWTKSLNPTTTASGVSIGQLTANANTSLDLSAMPKALYMPILTTVQRDALTPSAGMMIYNSTNSRMERYEGGQWLAMNNPIGITRVRAEINSTSWADIVNVSGAGRFLGTTFGQGGGGAARTMYIYPTIDSTGYNTLATNQIEAATMGASDFILAHTSGSQIWAVRGYTTSTAVFPNTGIYYKTGLQVSHRISATESVSTRSTIVYYEGT